VSTKVCVIPVMGTQPPRLQEIDLFDTESFLQTAQAIVQKGAESAPAYIERVQTPVPGLVMYVHEEGLLRNLGWNIRAQVFYPGPRSGSARIVGDVFLTWEELTYTDDGPDWTVKGVDDDFLADVQSDSSRPTFATCRALCIAYHDATDFNVI
jgi:hypothetical protein